SVPADVRVEYSKRAVADLRQIAAYFAGSGTPAIGERIAAHQEVCARIAGWPFSGHLAHSVVCPACSIAWGWKSPVQPDGGEGLAKHKGVIARWRLKAVWSKTAT